MFHTVMACSFRQSSKGVNLLHRRYHSSHDEAERPVRHWGGFRPQIVNNCNGLTHRCEIMIEARNKCRVGGLTHQKLRCRETDGCQKDIRCLYEIRAVSFLR